MSKASYTEEEVKKVLRSLFVEKRKVKELQQKVQDLGQERGTLREKLSLLESRAEAGGQLSGAILPTASLKDGELRERLESLQERVSSGEAFEDDEDALLHFEAISAQMAMMQQALTEQEREMMAAEETIERQKETIESLESRNESEQIQKLKRAVILMKKKLEAVPQAEASASSEELEAAEKRAADLTSELSSLKQQLAEASQNAQVAEQKLSERVPREDLNAVIEESNALKERLAAAEAAQFSGGEEAQRAAERRIQELRLQNEQLLKRVQEKEESVQRLQGFEFSFRQSTQEKRALEETVHSIQEELERRKGGETKLHHSLEGERQRAAEFEDKVACLEQQNLQLKSEVEALVSDNQSLTSTVEEVREETDRLLSGNRSKSEELNKLNERLSSLSDAQKQVVSLKESLSQVENQRDQALAKLRQRTTQIEETDRELELIKQTLIRGVRETKELESRYMDAVGEKVAAIAKAKQAQEELKAAQSKQNETEGEVKNAHEQQQRLGDEMNELRQTIESLTSQNNELQEQLNRRENDHYTLTHERETILSQLAEAHEKERAAQSTIESQKQELEQLAQLQEEIAERDQSLAAASGQITALKREADRAQTLEREQERLQENYEALREEFTTLTNQLEGAVESRKEAESAFAELDAHHQAKLQILSERSEELQRLDGENQSLASSLKEAESALEERDARIAQAQQHLAKKVKETTILHEKLENQKLASLERANQLNANKSKINELTRALELQQAQEKKLQNLVNENMRAVEAQAEKWEQKYLSALEKSQTLESRIRELQKMEEEYHKLHALMANLGNYFGGGTPQGTPAIDLPLPTPAAPAPEPVVVAEQPAEEPQPSIDLFGEPGPAKKPESSLFEEQR